MSVHLQQPITGCLLGTAVGDALGLPGEGLSRRRLARVFPDLSRMHFLGRRGMVSDDTEHTCLVAQALIETGGEPDAFSRALARRLRFWLLGGHRLGDAAGDLEALDRVRPGQKWGAVGGQRSGNAKRPAGRLLRQRSGASAASGAGVVAPDAH